MSGHTPKSILFIGYPGSNIGRVVHQVRQSTGALSLDHICLSTTDIHNISLDQVDVVLLDVKALQLHDIDADELSDALYAYTPVILLGDASDASAALDAIKAGAQDWILYENLSNISLLNTVHSAQRSYASYRDLVVNHARYQNVVEDQAELIYRCLPDCTLTFVNQAYANYLGKTVSELEGRSFSQLTVPDEFERYQNKICALTPAFPTSSYEKRIVNGDDIHWIHWSDRAFFDSNGVMLEVQSIGTDVTEIRCAAQEALDGKKRFQSLYQNAPIMMQELDIRGRILSVNKCWLEIMDASNEDVLGSHAFRYLHKSSRKNVSKALQELRQSGNVRNIPCRYVSETGRHINVVASATMDIEDEYQNIRILVVSNDTAHVPDNAHSESRRHTSTFQDTTRRY